MFLQEMKSSLAVTGVFFGLILVTAHTQVPGGFTTVAVNEKEVIIAADFAVQAQLKLLQKQDEKPMNLELVKILSAEQQVVAGMNYRLKLKVKHNDEVKTAEATIWWQAWRKPDPYQLTAWNWK